MVAVVAGFLSAPSYGITVYPVVGPSTMMDVMLQYTVMSCPGSVKVYTKAPESLPANLRAQIVTDDLWYFGKVTQPLDSLRAVVACKKTDSLGRFYEDAVTLNMSADVQYLTTYRFQDYSFLNASYDAGWAAGFSKSFLSHEGEKISLWYDYDVYSLPNGVRGVSGYVTPTSNVNLIYGVAVSLDLYRALQAAQGITVPNGDDERKSQYQPNILKAQYTSVVSDVYNSAKLDPERFLGLQSKGMRLSVCRFPNGSGVQFASDNYFLNGAIGSDGSAGGALTPADSENWGGESGLPSFEVRENQNAVEVRKCLSQAGYGIGVLTVENAFDRNPKYYKPGSGDRGFAFVKINGVSPFDVVARDGYPDGYLSVPKRMTHDAVGRGEYDFWSTISAYDVPRSNFNFGLQRGFVRNSWLKYNGSVGWSPVPGVYILDELSVGACEDARLRREPCTSINVPPLDRSARRDFAIQPVIFY